VSAFYDALRLQAIGVPVEVGTPHGWLLVSSWETGRLCRLLGDHDQPIRVPEWALPDFDVIRGICDACLAARRRWCDHAWPVPLVDPDALRRRRLQQERGGVSMFDIVAALAAAGCCPVVRGAFRWRALCPVCRMRGKMDRRLYIERDGATGQERLSTFCHCRNSDILAVLGLLRKSDDDA